MGGFIYLQRFPTSAVVGLANQLDQSILTCTHSFRCRGITALVGLISYSVSRITECVIVIIHPRGRTST